MFPKVRLPPGARFDPQRGRRIDPGGQFKPPRECGKCGRAVKNPQLLPDGRMRSDCCKRPVPTVCANCGLERLGAEPYCRKCGYGTFTGKPKQVKLLKVCPKRDHADFCGSPVAQDRCENPSCNGVLAINGQVTGSVAGRLQTYTVKKFLGMGAMGMVYLVQDEYGQTLALKEVRPLNGGSALDPKDLWVNEVQGLAVLKAFPEVVKPKGSFEEQVTIGGSSNTARYVLMEYLQGETLESFARKGPHDHQLVWDIMLQLTQAVVNIQQVAVLRDLKASNVMLLSTNPIKLRLFDFGFVHLSNSGAFRFPQGILLGTPGYGCVEQFGSRLLGDFAIGVRAREPGFHWPCPIPAQPDLDPSPRWDVHALGAIGYFLATGEDPCQVLYRWDLGKIASGYRSTRSDKLRVLIEQSVDLAYRRFQDAGVMLNFLKGWP